MFNQEIETIRARLIMIETKDEQPTTITESLRQALYKQIEAAKVNCFRQQDAYAVQELNMLRDRVTAYPSADPTPSAGDEQGKWPTPQLDPTDIEILRMKRDDSDLQGKEIAAQKNWDASDVSRRITFLKKIGFIEHDECTDAGKRYLDQQN